MTRKKDTETSHITTREPRNTDRIYNGSYEEYEDPADYLDVRRAYTTALKGRVVA